ncbi:MAG: SatD family protein [Lachnotalea sp.]
MFFLFSYNPYVAIIGDIKNSNKFKDRKSVQEKLKSTLEKINEKYEYGISAKFIITLGDEFQGLLCEGENVFNIVEEIQRKMYPVEIRFGIGVGAISTDINSEMALGADGPAYYMARKSIEFLKQNVQKNKTYHSDIRIEIDEDKKSIEEMLNTILLLLEVIRKNWTDRQREIIWDSVTYQDSQEKSAKRLEIAQSSVQRGLTNGNFYAYKEGKATINNVLKEIRREHV